MNCLLGFDYLGEKSNLELLIELLMICLSSILSQSQKKSTQGTDTVEF